ncbi:MAG: hypothetical protein CMJ59_22160 [Planctomycetaceae bacterium]|nr:hypothetical protein [Planctomycetaceae bacterium]
MKGSIAPLVAGLWLATVSVSGTRAPAHEYRVARTVVVADEVACMPAMSRAPNGDLVVLYSMQWEPFPWGDLLKTVVSKDGGATWSRPRVIWRPDDPRVTFQVGNAMQVLSNGDLIAIVKCWVVPKREGVTPAETRPAQIYDTRELQVNTTHPDTPYGLKESRTRPELWLLRSRDSGRSWIRKPLNIRHSRFGRPIETADGRLLMPMFGWYLQSRDFGQTWGDPQWFGTPFDKEVNLVQTLKGALFTVMRQNGELGSRRVFGTTRSNDGGATWSKWRLLGVRGKMPDLLVLPSGRILMAVGFEGVTDGSEFYRRGDRNSFATLFYSDNAGRTWQRDTPLAPVQAGTSVLPADNPCMVPLKDGNIFVVVQAHDRRARGPLVGYSTGLSLIGNLIEPANRAPQRNPQPPPTSPPEPAANGPARHAAR